MTQDINQLMCGVIEIKRGGVCYVSVDESSYIRDSWYCLQ